MKFENISIFAIIFFAFFVERKVYSFDCTKILEKESEDLNYNTYSTKLRFSIPRDFQGIEWTGVIQTEPVYSVIMSSNVWVSMDEDQSKAYLKSQRNNSSLVKGDELSFSIKIIGEYQEAVPVIVSFTWEGHEMCDKINSGDQSSSSSSSEAPSAAAVSQIQMNRRKRRGTEGQTQDAVKARSKFTQPNGKIIYKRVPLGRRYRRR